VIEEKLWKKVLQKGHHRKVPQLTSITVPAVDLEDRKVWCFMRDKPKSQTCREKQDIKTKNSIDFSHQTVRQSLYLMNETMSIVRELLFECQNLVWADLNNPVFINKEIWRLQISMHNGRMACVQVVHSLGLQTIRELCSRKQK
jgi:hypothetical protein